MKRFIEWLLGLEGGFLGRDGELSISFDSHWPLQQYVGAFTWNILLFAGAVALVWFIYRRDGRSQRVRMILGGLRLALLTLVIVLLNRPQLTVTQSRVEPSVLAILVDDSLSMRLNDMQQGGTNQTRLAAATGVLTAQDAQLIKDLAKIHQLRFYRFSQDAMPVDVPTELDEESTPKAISAITGIDAQGSQTRVLDSIQTVVRELQGQRLAGVVLLTDGRETDADDAQTMAQLADLGAKLYPVPVGTDTGLRNLEIETLAVQESVFSGDIVNVKVGLRGTGVPAGVPVRLVLKDGAGTPILDNGQPVETQVTFGGDGVEQAELQFVPTTTGTADLQIEAVPIAGEIDDKDNIRAAQIAVLDANIRVLYVDGYPRWEFRYLKQELLRDKTIAASTLLTSADASFAQEGDIPITRFPETLEELMEYDALVFGDVDPRQFTDAQLQLVNEFVSRRGGGFGMVAGPRFSPQNYRNTAIEPLLPVDITRVEGDSFARQNIAEGFRIALTEDGRDSSIFRFFRDPKVNEDYVKGRIQELFWYCRGITTKPGVGQTLAFHPRETGPDGRPAPIIVVGRFGTGRTLFSAIDDTWRWRYYTGEQIFNSYWVQSLRYLARGKKLGQRKLTFASERPVYQMGESTRLSVRVLDPQLLMQLPDSLRVQVQDERGQIIRDLSLLRRSGEGDVFTGGFSADRLGRLTARLVAPAAGMEDLTLPIEVAVPRLELKEPKVDRPALTRLATGTGGQLVELDQAANLPRIIPSAKKDIPLITSGPLWAAPLVFVLFTTLITAEWIARKQQGLV